MSNRTPDRATYIRGRVQADPVTTCWNWTGPRYSNNYGMACYDAQRYMAHRFVFVFHRGDIPDGLVLDHLCRNTMCVNPDHLEPVTTAENLRRGMSPNAITVRENKCKHGHDMTDARVGPNGRRRCRTCSTANGRKRLAADPATRGTCVIAECERVEYVRGHCNPHYQQLRYRERAA